MCVHMPACLLLTLRLYLSELLRVKTCAWVKDKTVAGVGHKFLCYVIVRPPVFSPVLFRSAERGD